MKYAPPIPATNPAIITFLKRNLFTSIPTVSAAVGCSPTARVLSPHLVLKRAKVIAQTIAYIKYTIIDWLKNIGPRTGIFDSNGISIFPRVGEVFQVD